MTALLHDTAAFLATCAFVAGVGVASIALTPCEFEDSRNCYWNASERGNGQGSSFVNVAGFVVRP